MYSDNCPGDLHRVASPGTPAAATIAPPPPPVNRRLGRRFAAHDATGTGVKTAWRLPLAIAGLLLACGGAHGGTVDVVFVGDIARGVRAAVSARGARDAYFVARPALSNASPSSSSRTTRKPTVV